MSFFSRLRIFSQRYLELAAVSALAMLFSNQSVLADASLQVEVRHLTSNALAVQGFSLGQLQLSQQQYLIPYYLKIAFPPANPTAWGIALYTNNNSDHAWTSNDGLYRGLRGLTNPQVSLPLFWQVYAVPPDVAHTWGTPQSVTTMTGGLGFYNDPVNGRTLQYWGVVKDRNDFDVVNKWDDPDVVADRTLAGYKGLGNFPATKRRLTDASTVYTYFGIGLGSVQSTQSFKTTLFVDLVHTGMDSFSKGGFARPNPFKPAAGQKTVFEFYVNEYNISYTVCIYSLRGRLLRSMTNIREWDGRDNSGRLVEGGLYLYQIESEGRRVSGTVVVVK